ncbi:hypothetical protein [Clostridium sp. E02]|uniref:hypothetical protein n=1 Tax=Clostridium sp. E02 TaxID=2487134 RepID=UPI000F54647E|nr:hypothetical protein [Clostridium sp. E02]
MEQVADKSLFFGGRLAVRIPDFLHPMETNRAEFMYPYEQRPQIILEDTNAHRFCTFSLLKEQKLAAVQVEYAIQCITKAIVGLYPSCLLSDPQLVPKKDGACGWFSFRSMIREGTLQNFMYVYSVDECMMLGTMGCFIEDEVGKKQMLQMMESLEVPERKPSYVRSSPGSLQTIGRHHGGGK